RRPAVALGLVGGRFEFGVQHSSRGGAGRVREGVEDGLAPGRAFGFGHDGCDDVGQLCLAGRGDAVAVSQQADEHVADHDGVRHVVAVLDHPGGDAPVVGGLCGGRGVVVGLVPDVPLVEGQLNLLVVAQTGTDGVGGGRAGVDEVVHVDDRGEEAAEIAVVFLVVGGQGDVIDEVVGLLQDIVLP